MGDPFPELALGGLPAQQQAGASEIHRPITHSQAGGQVGVDQILDQFLSDLVPLEFGF